jgi:hypothetical protein
MGGAVVVVGEGRVVVLVGNDGRGELVLGWVAGTWGGETGFPPLRGP